MKEKYCSISGNEIKSKEMVESLQLGKNVLPVSFKSTSNNYRLKFLKKITLSTLSDSLLIDNPIVLTPSISFSKMEDMFLNDNHFSGLSHYLSSNEFGVILLREGIINEFYLILGEKSGNTILMKKLTCKEEYLPIQKRKVSTDINITKKIYQMMNQFEQSDYNPIDYSSKIHEKLNETLKGNILKKK